MTPERAMQFLGDLHRSGWALGIGPLYLAATHNNWGCAIGRGDDVASMLDDLREQLRKRELCE